MYVNGHRQSIDELLARMQAVRGRLDEDAQAAKQTVNELMDWRLMVRKHPLLAVGLASAAGFLLVPRKQRAPIVSKADLEQLARENKIIVAKESTESSGLTSTLAAIAGAALTRAVTSLVTTKLTELSRIGASAGRQE